eukprot:gene56144-25343_t
MDIMDERTSITASFRPFKPHAPAPKKGAPLVRSIDAEAKLKQAAAEMAGAASVAAAAVAAVLFE